MQPTDDSVLLRQFADSHSDEAFTALVQRHINLVYSVALRHVGNPHNAEEIAQVVFVILAKKAAQLRHEKALSSWLFQTTRLTANNFIRSEMRQRHREQEAYMQTILNEPADEIWPQIAPLLDSAVAALREKDRRAVLLRFYEGRNFREVGAGLGASESAAEKRVNRALDKLRKFFSKRGVSSTTAILAGTVSTNSVHAAPAALAKTVMVAAMTKGATASTSTLTLVKGALKIMAWTKAKTAIVVGAGVLLAGGATMAIFLDSGQPPPSANQGPNAMATSLSVSSEFFAVPDEVLNKLKIRWHPMNTGNVYAKLDQSKLNSTLRTLRLNTNVNLIGKPRIGFSGLAVGKPRRGVFSETRSVKLSGTNANVGIILEVAASPTSTEFKSFGLNLTAVWRELADVSPSRRAIRTTTAKVSTVLSLGQTVAIRQPINGSDTLGKTHATPDNLLIFTTPQVFHERLEAVIRTKPAK